MAPALSQPYPCTLIQGGLSGGSKKSEKGGEENSRQEEACKEEKISNCSRKFEKGGSNNAFALRYFTGKTGMTETGGLAVAIIF